MFTCIDLCGELTIVTITLLGPISLLTGIVLFFFRSKFPKYIFIIIELLLLISFILFTDIKTDYDSCAPCGATGTSYKFQLLP
jgi:hypothetical protein